MMVMLTYVMIYVRKLLVMVVVHDRRWRLMHDRDGAAGKLEARVDQLHDLRLCWHMMVDSVLMRMAGMLVLVVHSVVYWSLLVMLMVRLTNFVCDRWDHFRDRRRHCSNLMTWIECRYLRFILRETQSIV